MSDRIITQQPLSSSAVDFEIEDNKNEGGFRGHFPDSNESELELQTDAPCHLARLATVGKLYIKESIPIQQAMIGNTVDGVYEIMDENMKLLYRIPKRRHTGCCAVWCTCCFKCYICCCASCINYLRGWNISDPTGRRPVVHVNLLDILCWKRMEANDPESDEIFGSVSQCCPIFRPFDNYSVHSKAGKMVLGIRGPSCLDLFFVNTCGRIQYTIKNKDGDILGGLERKQLGQVSNSDEFILTFPSDLDVRTKATLMAFVLYIDYTYLEASAIGRLCGGECCECC